MALQFALGISCPQTSPCRVKAASALIQSWLLGELQCGSLHQDVCGVMEDGVNSAVALLAYLPLLPHSLTHSNFTPHYCVDKLEDVEMLVTHLCPTLCNPMDCGLPGSFVHWIFQARILEWVASPFSRAYSWPRDWSLVSCIVGKLFAVWATREAPLINCFKIQWNLS